MSMSGIKGTRGGGSCHFASQMFRDFPDQNTNLAQHVQLFLTEYLPLRMPSRLSVLSIEDIALPKLYNCFDVWLLSLVTKADTILPLFLFWSDVIWLVT